MTLQTKLSEKDFVSAAYIMVSKRKFFRIILGMMIFIALVNIMLLLIGKTKTSNWYIVPIFISLFLCLIYYDATKSYRKTPRIQENIQYDFDQDLLKITGETFRTELTWDKLHKITREKKWLFIWQTQQNAHVIPERDYPPGLFPHLKSIADRHKLKNNL